MGVVLHTAETEVPGSNLACLTVENSDYSVYNVKSLGIERNLSLRQKKY